MIEGLWSVFFIDVNNDMYGGGIVVFETERIFGGDTSFYYIGDYTVDRSNLKANVIAKRHNDALPGMFGNDENFLEIVGSLKNSEITAVAMDKNNKSNKLQIKLIKVAELP